MAKNTEPNPYDGMLLFRQNHPYTKEEFEAMKQNFHKHCGPLFPAKDEPTSFVMLGYVSRGLSGELKLTHSHPSMADNFNLLPPDLFPEVQNDSEPLCVEIKLTPTPNIKASDLLKEQTEFQERILCNPDRPTDEEIWRDITGEIPMQEDKETVEETENIINVDEHQIFKVYEELIDIIGNFENQGSPDRLKLIDFQNNFIKLFGEHIFIKHYRKENNIPTPTPQYKVGDRMYIRYLNMVGTIDIVMGYNEEEDGIFYHIKVEPKGVATAREEWLMPYTEYQNLQNETRQ